MAKHEHLEILLVQGINAWNRWCERNPQTRPILNRADLNGANLFGADLIGADLAGANLLGADLFGTDLSRADLSGATLRGACLSEGSFRRANLLGADLSQAKLFRADLSQAMGLIQEQIDSAKGDENTKLPEDIQRPAHWETKRKEHRRSAKSWQRKNISVSSGKA